MFNQFIEDLKTEIKKLDKYHDRVINIGEVFNTIDELNAKRYSPFNPDKEKIEALIRYLEHYDYENLPVLMFPKEDASFLLEALRIQYNNFETKHSNNQQHNTEITYIHKDAENGKRTWFSYVLKGPATKEQIQAISNCLYLYDKGFDFFNPQLVRLPDGGLIKEEPDWFIWMENSVLPTDKSPTIDMTMEELVSAFQKAKEQEWNWDYLNKKKEEIEYEN